eukprot:1138065-Pelagomonas_calceolata.AAC.4
MPREKGPEWEYLTFAQPEGTDGTLKCEQLRTFAQRQQELPHNQQSYRLGVVSQQLVLAHAHSRLGKGGTGGGVQQ